MNFFVSFSLLFAIWSGYLIELGWLSGTSLISEILSAIAAAVVLVLGIRQRFIGFNPVYWLLLGFIFLNMLFGIVVNLVEPGPIVAGFRLYLKAIPFFFIPAVYAFSHDQIRLQIALVLASSFVQLPIAYYQRLNTLDIGSLSGDYTVGTLTISSHLSMFQISVIAILVAYKASGKLPFKYFLPALVLVALPTMINETKSTLFLLPLAVIVPMFLASRGKRRLKGALGGLALAAAMLAIFVPVYDYYAVPRWGYGILDFVTTEGQVERYLDKGAGLASKGQRVGRIDSYRLPLQVLAKDPVKLAFGLGAGNVRISVLGDKFSGRYSSQYEHLIKTGFALLLWETGLFGLIFVVLLQYRILIDVKRVSMSDSWYREMAAGWVFVVTIFLFGLLYKNFIANIGIAFPYWYFSGLLVAEARRLQLYGRNRTMGEQVKEDLRIGRHVGWYSKPDTRATM